MSGGGGPPVSGNTRLLPMMNSSWQTDVTQKITQLSDGTIERHITVDGMETRQRFHSSGAYSEWRPDGTTISHAANGEHTYAKGGQTMSVDNHGDAKYAGHGRVNIDTDGHVEFGKNTSIAVNGMAEIAAPKGHIKMSASEIAMSTTQGSMTINAARDVEMKTTNGRMAFDTQGAMQMTTKSGDIHMQSGGKVNTVAASDTNMTTGGNHTRTTKGNTSEVSQGTGNYQSKGALTVASSGGNVNITPKGSTMLGGTGATMPGPQTGPIAPTFGS
jgi:hypothetical protein